MTQYPIIDHELRDAIANLKKPPERALKSWDALVYNTAISDVLALIKVLTWVAELPPARDPGVRDKDTS